MPVIGNTTVETFSSDIRNLRQFAARLLHPNRGIVYALQDGFDQGRGSRRPDQKGDVLGLQVRAHLNDPIQLLQL
jgi:hypothetical protein